MTTPGRHMLFRVGLDDNAKQEHRNLSPVPRRDVNEVLERLRTGPNPRLDLALGGQPNHWRARAGRRWRVIYEVQPGTQITVRRIRRREVVYEGLERPPRDLAEPPPKVAPSVTAPAPLQAQRKHSSALLRAARQAPPPV